MREERGTAMKQIGENEQMIADYLNEGCTQRNAFRIGMEQEYFVLRRNKTNVSYEELTGVMRKLVGEGVSTYDEEGRVCGFYNEEYAVSFGPAAQLILTIFPQERLRDVQRIYESFFTKFYAKTKKDGFTIEAYGYQPYAKAEKLKLIPNRQYEYMHAYFKESGSTGTKMMRATAALRVAVDYEEEDDYVRKFRLACVLSPLLSFLTDNSPVYEGEPYTDGMLRSRIWDEVDASRCGLADGVFDDDFGFDRYASYVYEKQPILTQENGKTVIVFRQTAKEYYKERPLKKTEAAHLLTMVFPEVRSSQYIELCCADSMPQEYALAYAALIKGIFYNEEAMEKIEEVFAVQNERRIMEAKQALMQSGYHAKVYGMAAEKALAAMLAAAKGGLPVKEESYLEPFESLLKKQRTLAQTSMKSHKISV